MHDASALQYNAAEREVQATWGVVYISDGRRNKEIDTRIVEANVIFCVSFIGLWSQNRSLQTPQICLFFYLFLFRS